MKKILYFLFSIILTASVASAQDLSPTAPMTMPTDAEIMQTLDKFNFPPEQKEAIFKQTKQQLTNMYSSKDPAAYMKEQMGKMSEAQAEVPGMEEAMQRQGEASKQPTKQKKYANHPPLTKKRN